MYGYATFIYLFISLSTFGLFPLFVCACGFWPAASYMSVWMVWCKGYRLWSYCSWARTPILQPTAVGRCGMLVKGHSLCGPLFPRLVQISILYRPFGLMWGLSEITVEQFSISWIGSHIISAFPWRSCIFYIKVIWIMPGLLHSILNQANEDFRDISWYWQCALQEIQQSSVRIVSVHLFLTQPHPVIQGSKPHKPCLRYSIIQKKTKSMSATGPKGELAQVSPFHGIIFWGKDKIMDSLSNPLFQKPKN